MTANGKGTLLNLQTCIPAGGSRISPWPFLPSQLTSFKLDLGFLCLLSTPVLQHPVYLFHSCNFKNALSKLGWNITSDEWGGQVIF